VHSRDPLTRDDDRYPVRQNAIFVSDLKLIWPVQIVRKK